MVALVDHLVDLRPTLPPTEARLWAPAKASEGNPTTIRAHAEASGGNAWPRVHTMKIYEVNSHGLSELITFPICMGSCMVFCLRLAHLRCASCLDRTRRSGLPNLQLGVKVVAGGLRTCGQGDSCNAPSCCAEQVWTCDSKPSAL